MNERNYSLGDTFKVALECELKAIALERRHNKHNAAMTNQVEVIQSQTPLQPEEISEDTGRTTTSSNGPMVL